MSGSARRRYEQEFMDRWYPVLSRKATRVLLLEIALERIARYPSKRADELSAETMRNIARAALADQRHIKAQKP